MLNDFVVYAAGATGKSSSMGIIFTLAIWGAVFYFLLIRPNKKRQKQHKEMMENLKEGVAIITSGGIKGEVSVVTDEFVIIRVDKGVKLTVKKSSITSIYNK